MPDMVGFKYGEFSALPEGTTNGTIYVAKAADGKAYMYVDKDGEKLNITSPNATFYGEADWVDEETINVDLEGFSLEIGSQVTIKIPPAQENDLGKSVILNQTYLTVNHGAKAKMTFHNGESRRTLFVHSIWTFVYTGSAWALIGEVDTVNNGITISKGTTFVDMGDQEDWENYPAPLLVGNVAAAAIGVHGYAPSVKAFYEKWCTPTLAADGMLYVPGSLRVGEIDGSSSIEVQGTSSYDNLRTVTIDPNGFHIQDAAPEQLSMHVYFDGDGISIADDNNDGGAILMTISTESELNGITYWGGNMTLERGDYYNSRGKLSNIFCGTSVPSSNLGANGDVYIMYS